MTEMTEHIKTLAARAADAAAKDTDNGTRSLHLSQAANNLANTMRVLFDMRVPDTNKAAG